ncbi:GFA family protein [Novosphingobium aquimarinum]|uniref:GFA family protein n=1 Tax=Novosphingobium aquimarinum TaxID=2682494 RepID=UPI0012EC37F2|nr:GFA family protein [Novosphingobium aquimarinum]
MTAPYQGHCSCGAVSLEITSEPLWVRQCWCRQCRRIAASGPTNNALFMTDAMTVTGDVAWWDYEAASGNRIAHGFCATCGTQMFGRNAARDGAWVVRLGVLDDAGDLAPKSAIWTSEAPDWATIDPDLEQFEHQPPLPPRKD